MLETISIRLVLVGFTVRALAAGGSTCSNSSAAPYTLKQLATICDETFAVTNAVRWVVLNSYVR